MVERLISQDEMDKAINKLTQFLDVDEEDEQDDFPEYLRQKNNEEDYVEEPLIIDNLREIAKEIADMAAQNEELTKKIMKHQKSKSRKIHSYDMRIKRLYDFNKSQQDRKAELQFLRFQEEIRNLTWRPEISETSKKLAEKKNRGVPLFQRVKEEVEKKAKRREIEKVQVEFDRAVKNEEFYIQNKRKVVSSQIMNRSVEENWNKVKNFYAKKNELITQAHFEKLEKEVEGLTFKPTINEKTNKLMKNNSCDVVEDRILKKYIESSEKKQMMQEMSNGKMFEPFITNKSRKIVEKLKKNEEKNTPVYQIQYEPKHEFILKALKK